MSIASRINEMTEHLRNDWDGIDKLGLDITEENSNDNLDKNIENIAPVLNRFYNQSSDKTNLSENGIVGRTSQEGTTGKNLFDESLMTSIGGTIKYIPINVKKDTDYTLSTNSGTSTLANVFLSTTNSGVTTNNNGAMIGQPRTINSGDNNIMYVGYRNDLSSYWIQLEESSTATSYEPYTGGEPSPNPDYPQEINNLSGDVEYKVIGKNKLPFPYTETTHTHNGITYTINDDGTVLVNGTATALSNTKLYGNYQEANNKEPIGKYLYGGTNEVRVRALNHTGDSYTVLATDIGNGAEIDTSVYKKYYIEISVLQGVTVNNVLIKPMVLDSLDNLKYEPYISESFPLSLKSRNLFDKNNTNILNAYIGGGSGTIANSNGDKCLYISIKPNTTYTISKVLSNRFRIGCTDALPNSGITCTPFSGNKDTSTSYTITSNNSSKYLIIYYYVKTDILTEQQILDSIQIEEGSTATTYEPYYDIELCNISDYKDQIYSQNGEFYLEKKTGKVVLDGSENFGYSQQTNNVFYNSSAISNINTTYNKPYCNYFKGEENVHNAVQASNKGNNTICCKDYESQIYIINNNYDNINDFKAWLSTHNTEVQYVLATSTTTEITQENYPTLYSQLLAIQEFLTKYKINKEFLLDYSSPEIEY